MKCPKCNHNNPDNTRFCGKCGIPLKTDASLSDSPTATVQTPFKGITRGTQFAGRYEVLETIGRGGMGNVYRVFDDSIKEEIALKIIHPAIDSDEETK